MTDESEQFLAAEDAVQKLLEDLNRLKHEVEGFSQAKLSLEQARDAVSQLAATTSELAQRAARVIDTLGQIGTPEILSRLEKIRSSIEETSAAAKSLGKQASTSHMQLVSKLEESSSGLLGEIRRRHRILVFLLVLSIGVGCGAVVIAVLAMLR